MAKEKQYHGVVVPMVTPFKQNGGIDLDAAEKITDHIAGSGACPFALGTTGEAVSIHTSAKADFVEKVVKANNRRSLTYAGIIDNCMAASVEMAENFFELGADVVVACVPSYYPLTGDDILKYFENLSQLVSGPLMLYNIPMTTGVSIPLEIFDELSSLPKIIGLKDSVRDIDRIKQAGRLWRDREDFSYLCGCTPLSAASLEAGADGIVPSVGNIAPDLYVKLYRAVIKGDLEKADGYQNRSNSIGDIFQKGRGLSESLPMLKGIMHVLGFCEPKVLPPLRALNGNQIVSLKEAVDNMRLFEKDGSL
ncbi:MAG: dihydrodipicolinate synthase family protein [Sedimentisphaerales bacterium]|nr:dihydrodipicolinate synthase family protein [Sedimentisphaerales bacterium]